MLTPEYLDMCAQDVVAMYETLNRTITDDICRRIIKTGRVTDTAAWQTKQLQECGRLMDDIIADVAAATGKQNQEIAKMFQDAGVSSVRYDAEPLIKAGINVDTGMSGPMMNVLEANLRKTQGEMSNLVMTTASTGQETFVQAMNEAVLAVETGTMDYQTALRRAVDKAAAIGATVSYDTGAVRSLEAAARMNILTAIGQTAAQITIMNGERLGCEYYEVSAHAGARPSHQEWQGQVYKINGSEPDYPNFYEATDYGDVTGLCGVNCKHSFFPYFPGISERAYTQEMLDSYEEKKYLYDGERYTEYEASQIMRRYERAIRDSKRTLSAYEEAIRNCTDPSLKKELEAAYADRRSTYNARRARWTDFTKQTGMKKDYLRTRVARQGNNSVKSPKTLENPGRSGTINSSLERKRRKSHNHGAYADSST